MLQHQSKSNMIQQAIQRFAGNTVSNQTPYRICITLFAIAGMILTIIPNACGQEKEPVDLTPGLTKTQIFDGWLSLFDGQTLYGWKAESDVNWHISDGEIRADKGEMGLLRTTSQFDDFELTLEFKSTPKTNSGLFVRTSPRPRDPASDCF